MLILGVDIGAVSTKAVLIKGLDMEVYSILPTGASNDLAAKSAINEILNRSGKKLEEFKFIVTTGYGRDSLSMRNLAVSEILCHARGARWFIPNAGSVIDIGGQDSKFIRLDQNGNVSDFVMNDRCAAGSGRFLEVIAKALSLNLEALGEISLKSQKPCKITNICTVFIESEVISLRAANQLPEDIIAGIHRSIAKRIVAMISTIRVQEKVVFTGGVQKIKDLRKPLKTSSNCP